MIYNVSGETIQSAYDVSGGVLLHAYDINGVDILPPSHYSIDNVVSYFRQPTLDVANDIDELSDAWTSFVFITDTHGSGNEQHSQAIALYLLDNTDVQMIILGGDYSLSNWNESQYDTYMYPFLNSGMENQIYALMGNHETYGTGASASAKYAIYVDFLLPKSNITGDTQEIYYYFDDTERKIRYMCLNTSDEAQYNVSSEQISWITSNVVLPDTDWSLLVLGHVTLNKMGGLTYSNESNGSNVISAILNCTGEIIGYICGHQHIDILYYDGNIHYSSLYCDKLENVDYYAGYSITDRQSGTTSEQAVTVVSINTTTKDVVFRRIGVGLNPVLSYNYSQS